MDEEWKTISDFPSYEVSSLGRVRNWTTNRILSPGNAKGYLYVHLTLNKKVYARRVNRLVAAAFITPDIEGFDVEHVNTIRSDNRASNLEVVTHQENIQRIYRNTNRPGNRSQAIRLVETNQIFRSQTECAKITGIAQPIISECLSGKRASHKGYTFERVY